MDEPPAASPTLPAPGFPAPGFPDRTLLIRRAAVRLCLRLEWAPLHEVPLPNGRRADILALRPDGGFVCIEIKSGVRDFMTDQKWPEYRDFADALFFAVDTDFPRDLLPAGPGLIIAAGLDADVVRDPEAHRLTAPRRGALLRRFSQLAAWRLTALEDPVGYAAVQTASRVE